MRQFRDNSKVIRLTYESFFALNLAVVLLAFLFQYGPQSLVSALQTLESVLNRMAHIRERDYLRGYWEFFVPSISVALCIWAMLRLSCRTRLTRDILFVGGGVASVGLPQVWFVFAYVRSHGWNVFAILQSCEVAAVLGYVFLCMFPKRSKFPNLTTLLVFILHYTFWLWQFRFFFVTLAHGWGGAIAAVPVIGLCSGLSWLAYLYHQELSLRQHDQCGSNGAVNYSPKPL